MKSDLKDEYLLTLSIEFFFTICMIWPSRLLKQKSFLEIVKLSSRNGVSPSRVRVVDPCLLKFYNMEWSFVHKTWEKWASVSVGAGSSLKAALLLNYDPSGPSRLLSTIAEQEGIKVNPVELAQFMDLIKHDALQTDSFSFIIGPNQYVVTSIHENWLCARCMNTSKPAGEGAIIMQTAAFILVALYDGSIGSASRAMAAVDQFAGQLGRRNL